MLELLSIGSFLDDTVVWALKQVWSTRSDASWLTFEICVVVGVLGLGALLFLYPMARD